MAEASTNTASPPGPARTVIASSPSSKITMSPVRTEVSASSVPFATASPLGFGLPDTKVICT